MAITVLTRASSTPYPNSSVEMHRKNRYGYAEKPRLDSILPYDGQHVTCRGFSYFGPNYYPQASFYTGQCLRWTSRLDDMAVVSNRALRKLQTESLGVDGELGASVIEMGGTLAMIAARATTLRKSYKALKRGRFREFVSTLSVRPKKKHQNLVRSSPKDASSLWLEYWFGWAPLVGDIGFAVERLQNPFPVFRVAATAGSQLNRTFSSVSSSGYTIRRFTGQGYVKLSCGARVTNPNLYLANQLGFVNPASIAWAVVPFSFLVDWALPVGDFLDSFSAYFGLDITDRCTSVYVKGSEDSRYAWSLNVPTMTTTFDASFKLAFSRREAALPSFDLIAELPTISATRAATAMSLLVSALKG